MTLAPYIHLMRDGDIIETQRGKVALSEDKRSMIVSWDAFESEQEGDRYFISTREEVGLTWEVK